MSIDFQGLYTQAKAVCTTLLPPTAVAIAGECQEKVRSTIKKIEENPNAKKLLNHTATLYAKIQENQYTQAFTTNFTGSIASLIPENLRSYAQVGACLSGASEMTVEIVHAGLYGMLGRAKETLAKPIFAKMAAEVGEHLSTLPTNRTVQQIVQTMPVDGITGPLGHYVVARTFDNALKVIIPQAANLITQTSTATGGLTFLTGLLRRTEGWRKATDKGVQKIAKATFNLALGVKAAHEVYKTFCNASGKWNKLKVLGTLAVIGKMTHVAYTKFGINPVTTARNLALSLVLSRTAAAKTIAKAALTGGVAGGTLGALQLYYANTPRLREYAENNPQPVAPVVNSRPEATRATPTVSKPVDNVASQPVTPVVNSGPEATRQVAPTAVSKPIVFDKSVQPALSPVITAQSKKRKTQLEAYKAYLDTLEAD